MTSTLLTSSHRSLFHHLKTRLNACTCFSHIGLIITDDDRNQKENRKGQKYIQQHVKDINIYRDKLHIKNENYQIYIQHYSITQKPGQRTSSWDFGNVDVQKNICISSEQKQQNTKVLDRPRIKRNLMKENLRKRDE